MDQQRIEALGPAERIIQALTSVADHFVHNRPGIVTANSSDPTGISWAPATWVDEDGTKVVYLLKKQGKKTVTERVGTMNGDTRVVDGRTLVGDFRNPGLVWENVAYAYRQVADIFKMDNEFVARWASWTWPRDHKDMKALMCAFMLVQDRRGDPVRDNGEILFLDDDYRAIGEAMALLRGGKNDINPRLLLRVGDILRLPEVAAINRELGFGRSARTPPMGRYNKAVTKYLRYREDNPKMLKGLVKAGFKKSVRQLAQRVGYKPQSEKFFEILGWNQKQSKDGRRRIAVGKKLSKSETWEGKTEREICEAIVKDRPNWKRVAGMLPADPGMTPAIVTAAVESGCMSDAELVMLTPTLEELGVLAVSSVKARWKEANDKAENQRARNIARNVKSKELQEELEASADKATEKALEEVTRNIRLYVVVDRSSSMSGALEEAKRFLKKFLGGIPLDRLHVSVFNSDGKELEIRAQRAAAVEQAFRGISASGMTSYARGFKVIAHHLPAEDEDALVIFVGDEEDNKTTQLVQAIRESGVNPVAFGLLKVVSHGLPNWFTGGSIVTDAAAELGIPCFDVSKALFESDDPYVVTRTFRDLIAATPVGEAAPGRVVVRKTLITEILETPLLQKPVWA